MARKMVVRDLQGNIRDMRDDTSGGWIVRSGQVVNKEKWDELQKIEQDKKDAALAFTKAQEAQGMVTQEILAARAGAPSMTAELEKRVDKLEGGIEEILSLLKNK